jgi:hypothetical protein
MGRGTWGLSHGLVCASRAGLGVLLTTQTIRCSVFRDGTPVPVLGWPTSSP